MIGCLCMRGCTRNGLIRVTAEFLRTSGREKKEEIKYPEAINEWQQNKLKNLG